MSSKPSIFSGVKSSSSTDNSSISILQEEIPDLIFSRRADLRNIQHLQTLSGHVFDILKSLSELINKTFHRLGESCGRFSIDPSLVCQVLFLSVGHYYLGKAEQYESGKLNVTNENTISQIDYNTLLQNAFGLYLDLSGNSTQNSNGKKPDSKEKFENKNGNKFDIRILRIKKMSRIIWSYYSKLNFENWFTIGKLDIQEWASINYIGKNTQFDLGVITGGK